MLRDVFAKHYKTTEDAGDADGSDYESARIVGFSGSKTVRKSKKRKTVVVQNVKGLWSDVAYALNSYELSLLATNDDVAVMVEAFAPTHESICARFSPLLTTVCIDSARYREKVTLVQDLVVQAYDALRNFSMVISAAKLVLHALQKVGYRNGIRTLNRTLDILQTGNATYNRTLKAAEDDLPTVDGRPELMESSLSVLRRDDHAPAFEQANVLFQLENVFQKSQMCRVGGTDQCDSSQQSSSSSNVVAVVHEARVLHGSIVYEFLEAPQV